MSRRDFFLSRFAKAGMKKNVDIFHNPEVVIGKIVDFPIGKKILLSSMGVQVESLPEGLRVQSTTNERQFYPIRANQVGELIINRRENWPASQVLCLLTNEPACLEKSRE
jgi:hypothetical protein